LDIGKLELSGKSVKELKGIIEDAGLSYHDCSEKNELVARAKEAIEKGPMKPKQTTRSSRVASARAGQKPTRGNQDDDDADAEAVRIRFVILMPGGAMKKGRVALDETVSLTLTPYKHMGHWPCPIGSLIRDTTLTLTLPLTPLSGG